MTSSRLVLAASGMIARFAYRVSNRIIALTECFTARLREAGVSADRITVIPPWADRAEFHPTAPDVEFGREFGLEGKRCIIHAGNIGPYQDIGNVLAAADLLRGEELIRFVFVGSGQHLVRMKELAAERRLDNVVFAGRFPMERMSGILAWGTALLVSMAANPYLAITVPSKLAAYLAVERPLIAVAEGDVAGLVEGHRLGVVAPPGEPALLAAAIRQILSISEGERGDMGRRSGELFARCFEKELLRDRYVALLEELAAA
jgi:glycosyltransferase involved in cell wall biosynthesis